MLKRLTIISLSTLFLISALFADQGGNDIFGYMWTDSKTPSPTISYDWIDARDGTAIFTTNKNDSVADPISLPFTFSFYGTAQTQIYVSTNGFISFADLAGNSYPTNADIPGSGAPDNLIAPYWDDLTDSTSSTNVYYKTVGASPNRKFVVSWVDFKDSSEDLITFELILFERSNLIKLQYNSAGAGADGSSATVGIEQDGNDGSKYSFDSSSVTPFSAILFHSQTMTNTVSASISPLTVQAGTNLQQFKYTLEFTNSDGLGKLDRIAIANPFSGNTPTVTDVKISESNVPIQNSATPPDENGFATWNYNSTDDSIIVQTSNFNIKDSIIVTFVQNIPTSVSTGNSYASTYNARLDNSATQNATEVNWDVTVEAAGPHHFTKATGVEDSLTVGTNRTLTVTLFDEHDNPISGETVSFTLTSGGDGTFVGSGTSTDSDVTDGSGVASVDYTASTLTSDGPDVIEVSVNSVVATISIPLQSDAVDSYAFTPSGDQTINAGGSVSYVLTAKDQYSNNVVNSDNINLSFSGSSTATSSRGTSFAFNNSDTVMFRVSDTVVGSFTVTAENADSSSINGTSGTITVNTAVAHHFTKGAGVEDPLTVGTNRTLTVTLFDEHDNPISGETVSFTLTSSGDGTFDATGTANRDTVTDASGVASVGYTASTLTSDGPDVIEVSVSSVNTTISIPLQVDAASAIVGTNTTGVVGEDELIRARLEDQYGNPLSGETLNFAISSGGGSLSSSSAVTDNNGNAEVTYTLGTDASLSPAQITVSYAGVPDEIIEVTLNPGQLNSYAFEPATDQNITAGGSLDYVVRAQDVYENPVPNSQSINLSTINSTTAQFNRTNPVSFGGQDTIQFRVTETTAGSFRVRATNTSNSFIVGESGIITVDPDVPNEIVRRSFSDTTVVVGTTLDIRIKLQDQYGNGISGESVLFEQTQGDASGKFTANGTSSITKTTSGSGIANAFYRASTNTSVGSDKIEISHGGLTPIENTINLTADTTVSYYTITPQSGSYSYQAGESFTLEISAFDAFNNLATEPTRSLTLTTTGAGVEILSANPVDLSNGTAAFSVADTVKEDNITFTVSDNVAISATSSSFFIQPADLNELRIYSSRDTSQQASNQTFSITADDVLTLYSHGFDVYGNYIGRIDSSMWSTTGGLEPVATNVTGESFSFSPTTSEVTGTISLEISTSPGITGDATGTVTVNDGVPAGVKILQSTSGDPLQNISLTAGQTTDLLAALFDGDDNLIDNTITADWSMSPDTLGLYQNGSSTITANTVTFQANKSGSGTIQISYNGGQFTDNSGIITVNNGSAEFITIRDLANGGGTPYQNKTVTMTTDSSITLYAAHYDTMGNFLGDQSVSWSTFTTGGDGLVGVPTGPAKQITYSPTQPGSGFIQTTSTTLTNDTTDLVTVQEGATDYIAIQDAFGPTGNEVGTSTLTAGESLDLFVSGYDKNDNYTSDIPSDWSLVGDPIGSFSDGTDTASTTFSATTSGQALIQADAVSGSLSDVTSTITVNPADPNSLAIFSGNEQSGPAGQPLPLPTEVEILDEFGNPVPNVQINWLPKKGGSVSPSSSQTDSEGIAQTTWTLHSTVDRDTLAAYVAGFTTTPDTVYFGATSEPLADRTMEAASDTLFSAPILNDVGPFQVRVLDSLGNPAESTLVRFSVVEKPNGATGSALSQTEVYTNSEGIAQTTFTIGSKLGVYEVVGFANADPNQVIFTTTANVPGAADSIKILTGNNQNGTVGQPLSNPVRVQLVDAYDNPISGSVLEFNPINGGSVGSSQVTTASDGTAETTWTMGQTAQEYNLEVQLQNSSITSPTFTATASNGPADDLELISIRGIPLNSVSAMPNGSVPYVVQVNDQFGNPVPGVNVNCEVISGDEAVLSNSVCTTDVNGRFTNSVIIDATQDLTVVRSSISGVGSVDVNIYRIYFVAGTIDPSAGALGQSIAFSLDITNPGPHSVDLNTSESFITFTDGTHTYQAPIQTNSIPGNSTGFTVNFESRTMNDQFTIAAYTPKIVLRGSDVDELFSGSFFYEQNAFRVLAVELTDVNVTSPFTKLVRRGEPLEVTLVVKNDGTADVRIDTDITTPIIKLGSTTISENFTKISSGEVVPAGFQAFPIRYQFTETDLLELNTTYTSDGQFAGSVEPGGAPVPVTSALSTDTFKVIQSIDIQYVGGLTPTSVTSSDTVKSQFSLNLRNTAETDVVLDPSSTYLSFGSDIFNLSTSQTLVNNSTTTLFFNSGEIQSGVNTGGYPVTVNLVGQENGKPFSQELTSISDEISVYAQPINVVVENFSIAASSAGQGEEGISLSFDVSNLGGAQAALNINSALDFDFQGQGNIITSLISPLSFPQTIFGGNSVSFEFELKFPENYPDGLETVTTELNYQDANSNREYVFDDPTVNDQIQILEHADLKITNIIPEQSTVSQGQSDVSIQVNIQNAGEVAAQVNSADLSFVNAHTVNLITSPLPQISPGGTESIEFTVDIDSSAALGDDPITGIIGYTDLRNNITYAHDSTGISSLFIQSFNPALVNIHSITIQKSTVNQGQSGILASVKVRNNGEAEINVTAADLLFDPIELNQTIETPLPLSIPGEENRVLNVAIDIPAGAALGPVAVDAQILYEDVNSGRIENFTGAITTDTLIIQIPGDLQLSEILIGDQSTATVSAGKENLSVNFSVTNVGQSSIKLDDILRRNISSQITTTRISPINLPLLAGSESVDVQYRIDNVGTQTGSFSINFEATGTDPNDNSEVASGVSDTPANLIVRQPGLLVIDSLVVSSDTLTTGQDSILTTVYTRNSGGRPIRVNDLSLSFNGQSTGFATFLLDTLNFRLNPEQSKQIDFYIAVLENAPLEQFTVDAEGTAQEIDLNSTITANSIIKPIVTVVQRTQLALQASIAGPSGATDGILSSHQSFVISAQANNVGTSPTVDTSLNKIRVSVPEGYYFQKYDAADTVRILSVETNTPRLISVYTDTIPHPSTSAVKFNFEQAAIDQNTQQPAIIVDNSDRLQVRTIERAKLTIQSIFPDTVNQNFDFQIGAIVKNLGVAGLTENEGNVRIDTSGTGISLANNVVQSVVVEDTAWWNLSSVNLSGDVNFSVTISENGLPEDENTGEPAYRFKPEDAFQIYVLEQPPIAINSVNFTKNGNDSLEVSTEQENIILSTEVQLNQVFSQNRKASISLPEGFNISTNIEQEIPASGIIEWSLKAPAADTSIYLPINIEVQATSPVNGQTVIRNRSVYIKVTERTNLVLNAQISAPVGARNDTVSYGQTFTYRALVENRGKAGINGAASLKLTSGEGLNIVNQASRAFQVGEFVTWEVQVDSNDQVSQIKHKIQKLEQKKNSLRQGTLQENSKETIIEIEEIDAKLKQYYADMINAVTNTMLSVEIDTIPLDELSGKPSQVTRGLIQTSIVIQPAPVFDIDNVEIPSVVSTGQIFNISTNIDASIQISEQRHAKLEFINDPYGFEAAEVEQSFAGETVTWQIQAPPKENVLTSGSVTVKMTTWADDQNSGSRLIDSTESSLIIERQAVMSLNMRMVGTPDTVTGHRLSFDQPFKISAKIENFGFANASGVAKLKLNFNKNDLSLAPGETAIKEFNYPSQDSVTWSLRTPSRLMSTNLRVNFVEIPIDENTSKAATLDDSTSVASLSIATEIQRLIVQRLNLENALNTQIDRTNRQGTSNYPIIGFTFSEITTNEVTISIDSLKLSLWSQDDTLKNPSATISRIIVANPAYFRENFSKNLSKANSSPILFAEQTLDESSTNEIEIKFDQSLEITPNNKDSLVVFVDIPEDAPNKNFQLKVEYLHAYIGNRANTVQVEDQNGNLFGPQNSAGLSDDITVISRDETKIFGNYPNPFGTTHAVTNFVFWMEGPGSADLRIYTLMGGLVYSKTVEVSNRGLFDGLLNWDGVNDAGNRVLNGVYLAVLRIDYASGDGELFKTKIAYIK